MRAYSQQIEQLKNIAASRGATVSGVKLVRTESFDGQAAHTASTEPSCTATATVSIPGGTGVTLSATASTCMQAIRMVQLAIQEYLSNS
jgi:hypothetical protein